MDLIITEFKSRRSPNGKTVSTTWEEFVDRLKNPFITDETLDEYKAMSNEQRTEVKDVGGYVAGEFVDGRRNKAALKSRYVLTIDADEAKASDVEDFEFYDEPWLYFVHSTHTSTETDLRLRWLFPLSRPVDSLEYRGLVKFISKYVGASSLDDTTDQPERLMFWPSVSLDADYNFWEGGSVPLDVDAALVGIDLTEEDEEAEPVYDEEGMIPEGARNKALFRISCQLRQIGFDDDLLLKTISELNKTKCSKPLVKKEVKEIVRSACKFSPGDIVKFNEYDSADSFGDLGKFNSGKKQKKYFESGTELLKRYIEPTEYLVEDMVSIGMGLVVAPPKFGKSWFALDLAISVATGTDFFGKKTKKSGVLYYALEDNDKRLQKRMEEVANERSDLDLFFHSEEAPTIENGLFGEIEEFLADHPETKLVVIDTLQKVRGTARRTEGAYGYDYRETGEFQRFAFSHDIAIILVHHTRKIIDPNDLIGNVSGTNGVSGAADFVFGMSKKKWNDDEAKLEITGRDVEPQSYMMVFNKVACRWECLGKEAEVRQSYEDKEFESDPLVKTIRYRLDAIADESQDDYISWEVTPNDLLDCIEQMYGRTEIDSAQKIGTRLRRFSEKLRLEYEVSVKKEHSKAGNYYSFTRPRLVL